MGLKEYILFIKLPFGECLHLNVESGVQGVNMLGQVDVDYAVVVEVQVFTKGIQCDFESSIKVSFQGSGEIEIEEESEIPLAQLVAQFCANDALALKRTQQRPDLLLKTARHLRTDAAPINSRVLLIDTGRERKRQA